MRNLRVTGIEAPIMEFQDSIGYLSDKLDNLPGAGSDIVLLPEKWISNVFVEGSQSYDSMVRHFSKLGKEYGITLVPGSLNIQRRNGLFNSSPVFAGGELAGWQDKLVPFSRERRYYEPGNEIRAFSSGNYRFGIQVCYDLDFPFVTKMQALEGIDVILNPALIVSEFHSMWYLYVKTRSLENRIPVISVNSISEPFLGGSISTAFSAREGGVLLRTVRAKDGMITCSVNTEMVRYLSGIRRKEDPGSYSLGMRE